LAVLRALQLRAQQQTDTVVETTKKSDTRFLQSSVEGPGNWEYAVPMLWAPAFVEPRRHAHNLSLGGLFHHAAGQASTARYCHDQHSNQSHRRYLACTRPKAPSCCWRYTQMLLTAGLFHPSDGRYVVIKFHVLLYC